VARAPTVAPSPPAPVGGAGDATQGAAAGAAAAGGGSSSSSRGGGGGGGRNNTNKNGGGGRGGAAVGAAARGASAGLTANLTAGLTAYYTFRVFFRVFVGQPHHEPGDELHDPDDSSPPEDHHAPDFHPHPPRCAINSVLATLTVLTLLASVTYFIKPSALFTDKNNAKNVITAFVYDSSANDKPVQGVYYEHHDKPAAQRNPQVTVIPAPDTQVPDWPTTSNPPDGRFADYTEQPNQHGTIFGFDPHKAMYYVSAVVGLIGILIAAFLHGPVGLSGLLIGNRTTPDKVRADNIAAKLGPIPKWAENKWYVDEFYHLIIVAPLKVLSHIFHLIDKLIVDGRVNAAGLLPRGIAKLIRPSQDGVLHTYATGMAMGVAVIMILVWVVILANGNG